MRTYVKSIVLKMYIFLRGFAPYCIICVKDDRLLTVICHSLLVVHYAARWAAEY
jgi:hypothetical protein